MVDSWGWAYEIDSATVCARVEDKLQHLQELSDDSCRLEAVMELTGWSFPCDFLQSRAHRESLRLAISMDFDVAMSPTVYGCMIFHAIDLSTAQRMCSSLDDTSVCNYVCTFSLLLLLLEYDWDRLLQLAPCMAAVCPVTLQEAAAPQVLSSTSSSALPAPRLAPATPVFSVQSACDIGFSVLVSLALSLTVDSDFVHSSEYRAAKTWSSNYLLPLGDVALAARGYMLLMLQPCLFEDALLSVRNVAADFPNAQCRDPFCFVLAFRFYRDVFLAFLHVSCFQLGILYEAQPRQDLNLQSALAASCRDLQSMSPATVARPAEPAVPQSLSTVAASPSLQEGAATAEREAERAVLCSMTPKVGTSGGGGKSPLSAGKCSGLSGSTHGTSQQQPAVLSSVAPVQPRVQLSGSKSPRKFRVVEVFAGLGALAIALCMFGCDVYGVCEKDPLCLQLLQTQHPGVHVCDDFYSGKWRHWPPTEIDVLCGGPSCTPFSRAGKQRGGSDSRSSQLADMASMAAHFQPRIVLVENVFSLLDWPDVLAQADAAYDAVGYTRVVTHRIRHDAVGGDSTRHRVFLVYEQHDKLHLPALPELHISTPSAASLLKHLLPVAQLPSESQLRGTFTAAPPSSQGDDALLLGHLRWQEGPRIRRGSLVTLRASASTWRVMKVEGSTLHLLRNNRKFPTKLRVPHSSVVRRCPQRLPVFSIHAASKSPRAFGEWPVRTVMLVYDDRCTPPQVRALEPSEVWSLMELPAQLLAAARLQGADVDHLYRLAGNSIPASMVQPPVQQVFQRLQYYDAALATPGSPSASVHGLLALICFDADNPTHHCARAYVGEDGLLPSVRQPASASRASTVSAAINLLPPPLNEVQAFLVAERSTDQGPVRVVTAPTQHLRGWTLPGSWVATSDIASEEHQECAQLAALSSTRLLPKPPQTSLESVTPVASAAPLTEGKRPAKRLRPTPIASDTSAQLWDEIQSQARQDRHALRDALLQICPDDPDFEYLQSWVPRILEPDVSEVSQGLRSNLGVYSDPALAHVLFTDRCQPPVTAPLSRLPPQQPVPGFTPTSLRHIFKDVVLDDLIPTWLRAMLHDLRNYRLHGPSATRSCNKPLVVGQDLFQPQARGKVWDLRQLSQGVITLLDYEAPISTILNLDYIQASLENFPDQEVVSFLLEGVQFKADLDLQLVFLPHLLSLSHGIFSVEEELQKLAARDYYGLFEHLPFAPCRLQPLGAVPRKLGPWRRIMDAGAPRKLVYDDQGFSVVSLNEASKGVKSHHKDDIDWQTQCCYEVGRWPPECKPCLADYAHDACILKHASHCSSEPVFCFNDDISNYFHSFALAPQELWKVCCLYLPLCAEHQVHTFAAEYVLAMGIFSASNIAQRVSHAIVHLVNQRMQELEDAAGEDSPELQAWLQSRSTLGPAQSRLWALGMCTDDSHGSVVGVQRTIRLLRAWHHVMRGFGFVMAVPEKRQLGTSIVSLGAQFFVAEGLIVIPRHKILRALSALKQVCDGSILQGEYRSLLGLLEHLLILHCGRRDIMYGLYWPMQWHSRGPTDALGATAVEGLIAKQGLRWQRLLLTTPGCNFFHSLPNAPQVAPTGCTYHLYSDAALEGTDYPALGGYFHGFHWDLPLTPELRRLHITHLEMLGVVVNIMLFVQTVLPVGEVDLSQVRIVAHCDALTSVDVIARNSASSHMLQQVHLLLLDTPEFQRIQHVVSIQHIWGEANFLSDACSRGNLPLLRLMCSQLGVTPQRVEVGAAALQLVRTAYEFFCMPKFGDIGYEGEGPSFSLPSVEASLSRRPSICRPRPPRTTPAALPSRRRTTSHRNFSQWRMPSMPLSIRVCRPASGTSRPPLSFSLPPAALSRPCQALVRPRTTLALPTPVVGRPSHRSSSTRRRTVTPPLVSSTAVSAKAPKVSKPSAPAQVAGSFVSSAARSHLRGAPTPPSQMSHRMLDLLQGDTSTFAMCPESGDWGEVGSFCTEFETALQSAGNPNTLHKYRLHWDQYWRPFSRKYLRGKEFRTDSCVLTSASAAKRETFVLYCFLIYCRRLMPAKSKADKAAGKMAKPQSVVAPLKAVRYLHKHCGYGHLLLDLSLLSKALRGMSMEFKARHGQDSLVPNRKYGMPFAVTNAMICIPDDTKLGRSSASRVSRLLLRWMSFIAAMALCKVTGYRKAEVAVRSLEFAVDLMFSNVVWFINGVETPFPTVAQMQTPNVSYVLCIAPPPSKADQTNEKYGMFRAYIRWSPSPSNTANVLAQLEAAFPVAGPERSSTPLFRASGDAPLTHSQLDSMLAKSLKYVATTQPDLLSPDHLHRYSWHSFRRGLAMGLRKLKVSDHLIQMYCRWASPRSLEAYALLDMEQYADQIAEAELQTFVTISGKPDYQLPQIDDDDRHIRVHMAAMAEQLDLPEDPH